MGGVRSERWFTDRDAVSIGFGGQESVEHGTQRGGDGGRGIGNAEGEPFLGVVEARERKLVVSSDKIAGSDLSSEADAAAALT